MIHPALRDALDAILGRDRASALLEHDGSGLTATLDAAAIYAFCNRRPEDLHSEVLRQAIDLAARGRLDELVVPGRTNNGEWLEIAMQLRMQADQIASVIEHDDGDGMAVSDLQFHMYEFRPLIHRIEALESL